MNKELKHLGRRELVDIIYQLKTNEEELQQEIEALKLELEDKRFRISSAGSIADASISVTNMFSSAQETADIYLSEIAQIKEDAEKECANKLETVEKDCAKKTEETNLSCAKKIEETNLTCAKKIEEAEIRCAKKVEETEKECNKKIEDAQKKVKEILVSANNKLNLLKSTYKHDYARWQQIKKEIATLEEIRKQEFGEVKND